MYLCATAMFPTTFPWFDLGTERQSIKILIFRPSLTPIKCLWISTKMYVMYVIALSSKCILASNVTYIWLKATNEIYMVGHFSLTLRMVALNFFSVKLQTLWNAFVSVHRLFYTKNKYKCGLSIAFILPIQDEVSQVGWAGQLVYISENILYQLLKSTA